jgi:hypothetical protein
VVAILQKRREALRRVNWLRPALIVVDLILLAVDLFLPLVQRTAFRRRDVRQLSKLFALYDPGLRPTLQPALLRLSAMISQ